jgi:ribosomal protein S11
LQVAGITFDAIVDRTPIAHGGCRAPKARRV